MNWGLLLGSLVLTHFAIFAVGYVKGARRVDQLWQKFIKQVVADQKVKVADLYPVKSND